MRLADWGDEGRLLAIGAIDAGLSMNVEVIGAAVAVVGALLWIRRDMRHDIGELRRDLNSRVEELRRDLTAQIAAVNTRIDVVPGLPAPTSFESVN